MKTITSDQNPIFKDYRKLLYKKHRDQQGKYLMEGEKPVREALGTGQQVEAVLLAEGYGLMNSLPQAKNIVLSNCLFDILAETETSQGIMAVVKKEPLSKKAFLEKIKGEKKNLVILDRLQDPGNIGTIIRTADAAGYAGMITIKGTGDVFSPKVVRAAAGSLFRIPVLESQSSEQAVELLRKAGKRIISTCPIGSRLYYQTPLRENIGLIIGNEGTGISQQLMDCSDEIVNIPMEGPTDSLNVAIAAGILMYELVRK